MEKCFLLHWLDRVPAAIEHFYTLFMVTISWALFSVEDIGRTALFLRAMFGGAPFWSREALYLLLTSVPLLAVAAGIQTVQGSLCQAGGAASGFGRLYRHRRVCGAVYRIPDQRIVQSVFIFSVLGGQNMRNKVVTVFFCLLLAGALCLSMALPDKYYSESEKRLLTQREELKIEEYGSGKFQSALDRYLTDQFPGRDGWISLKTPAAS